MDEIAELEGSNVGSVAISGAYKQIHYQPY